MKKSKNYSKKKQPRSPDILRKGGPMRDRSKYSRKEKHKGDEGVDSEKE